MIGQHNFISLNSHNQKEGLGLGLGLGLISVLQI